MPVPRAHCGANAAHLLASLPGSVWLLTLPSTGLLVEYPPRPAFWQEGQEAQDPVGKASVALVLAAPSLPV